MKSEDKSLMVKLHDATTLCLEEFREREDRKLNIIVFNVPENERKRVVTTERMTTWNISGG